MKTLFTICLCAVVLCYVSSAQDNTTTQDKRRQDREAAIKKAADADLPIIEDTDFSINIISEKAQYGGGELIQVDVTFKNDGASKTKLSWIPVERFFDIKMIGPYGDKVATPILPSYSERRFSSEEGRFLDLGRTRVLPGTIFPNHIFDMSLAGKYQMQVSKRFRLQGQEEPVAIRSNTLEIEVTSTTPTAQWRYEKMLRQ